MAELTASATFSVQAAASLVTEQVTVSVITAPAYPGGTGRLSHPTFGVYDYEIAPDEWVNLDSSILYPPIWQHTRTLSGTASTRWAGEIMDVEVTERWANKVAVRAAQFRMFVDMWRNPPATGEIVWSPNYVTSNSYNVQIVNVSTGGSKDITLDYLSLQGSGFVKGPLEIVYRVKSLVGN
jgi:hypothetical protein